jgi:predicted nucleic acid-binding protein
MADAWIAASALQFGVPLISHAGDYSTVEGLMLLSADLKILSSVPRKIP